ncbi:hypothetical protein V8F06_005678 [Rhypophila decipiens]
MRRPIGFRKAPPASAGWSMIEQITDVNFNTPRSPTRTNMKRSRTTSTATSPTSTTSSSSRSSLSKRDTGFPEGFCGNRNTSLPHPNANLSPNACLTEDDIAITRALARHRMSFIAQKERQHRLNNQHNNGGLSWGMALNAIEEKESESSTTSKGGFLAGGRDPSFSTVGRLALSSLHGAEFRRHLRRPGSNGTNASDDSHGTVRTVADSVFSEGEEHEKESRSSVASSAPSSPAHLPAAYGVGELTRSPDMMTTGLLEKSKTVGGEGVTRRNDPREEKRDPRDGRIPVAGFERTTSGNGVKKSTWIRRLLHR